VARPMKRPWTLVIWCAVRDIAMRVHVHGWLSENIFCVLGQSITRGANGEMRGGCERREETGAARCGAAHAKSVHS
jgi:hypothetical protein